MTSVSFNNSSQLRASDHSSIVPNADSDPFSRKLKDSKNPGSSGVARPRSKRDTGTALQRDPDINEVRTAFREMVQAWTPLDPTDASSAVIDKFLSIQRKDILSPLEHRELMMQLAISVAGLSRDLDWETQRYLANAMAIALIPDTVLAEISEALMNPNNPFYYDGVKFRGIEGLTSDQGIDVIRNIIVDKLKTLGGFSHKAAWFLVRNLVYDLDFVTMNAPYDNIRYGKEYFTKIAGKNAAAQAEKQRRHEAWGETLLTVRADAVYNIAGSNAGIVDSLDALNRANQIHARAKMPGATEEEKERSKILLYEEARLWAQGNGDRALYGDKEKQLTYYLQAQEASMASLTEPKFETRLQIAQGMAKDAYWKVQQLLDTGATSGVDVAYYKQFSDYLEKNGEAFAKTTAHSQAVNGKPDSLLPSEYNAPITRIWNFGFTGTSHYVGQYPFGRHVQVGPDKLYAVTIVEINGRFIAIHPDGEIHKFKNNNLMAKDGTLNGLAILEDITDQKIPSYAVTITGEKPTYVSGKTTKDIAEEMAHKGLRTAIDQFKEANYSATAFQKFLSIIPFYDTISGYSNDPLWQPDTASIVLDSLDAILTIGSVGAATIGKAGLKTIQAATKGLSGAAKAGKILSMAATQLLSKRGALKFAREITDFVLPVFTAREIIAGVAKAGVAGKNALIKALKGANSVQEIVPTAIKTALPSVGSIPPQYRDIQIGQSRPWQGPYGNDSLLVTRLQDTNEVVALKSQGGGSYRQVHWETGQALSNTPLVYKDKAGNFIRAGLKGGSPTRTIPLIFSQQEIASYRVSIPAEDQPLRPVELTGFARDSGFFLGKRGNLYLIDGQENKFSARIVYDKVELISQHPDHSPIQIEPGVDKKPARSLNQAPVSWRLLNRLDDLEDYIVPKQEGPKALEPVAGRPGLYRSIAAETRGDLYLDLKNNGVYIRVSDEGIIGGAAEYYLIKKGEVDEQIEFRNGQWNVARKDTRSSPSPTPVNIGTPTPPPGGTSTAPKPDGAQPSPPKKPRIDEVQALPPGGVTNAVQMPPELTNGSEGFWRRKSPEVRQLAANLFQDGRIRDVTYGNGGESINGTFDYEGNEYRFSCSVGRESKVTFQDIKGNPAELHGINGRNFASFLDEIEKRTSVPPRGVTNAVQMPPELTNGSGNFWRQKSPELQQLASNLFRDGRIRDVTYGNSGREINGRFNYLGNEYRFSFSGGTSTVTLRDKYGNPADLYGLNGLHFINFLDKIERKIPVPARP